MKTFQRTIPAGIATLLLAISMTPATAQEPAEPGDLLKVTCADYMHALSVAKPGDKASRDQKEAAERAQDDIASAMLWVHGYQSGRQPTGTAFEPLTRQWMADQVVLVANACKAHSPDGKMALADVATRP